MTSFPIATRRGSCARWCRSSTAIRLAQSPWRREVVDQRSLGRLTLVQYATDVDSYTCRLRALDSAVCGRPRGVRGETKGFLEKAAGPLLQNRSLPF